MRLVVFASGSSGNCALVRGEHTALLSDAGISMRRIREALRGEGLTPGDLSRLCAVDKPRLSTASWWPAR